MKNYLFIFFLFLLLTACKKEKTSWNTDWSAPLVHGRLTLQDLIPDENITDNSGGYASIVYNEAVYSFSIDTLIDLPDTNFTKKTAINLSSVTVNPGFSYGDSYDQEYDLGEIELKNVIVKSGEIKMTIRSPWPGKAKVEFDFPTVTKNGSSFYKSFDLDAGSVSNPSIASDIIDISGFQMDLTGLSGNLINSISGDITVSSNETTDSYSVTNSDSIEYEVSFTELIPDYAKGYFGSYTFTDTTAFDLPFMDAIIGGSVNLDSIDLNIIVKNGFNLIAQAKISQVKGVNSKSQSSVDLNFPLLNNSLNINPASGGLYDYVPSEYPIVINNGNSNVLPFIENLPDSIYLGYQLDINPNGNVTAGSDELFPGSTMDIVIDGEFPLNIGADNLALTDTFSIDYNASGSYTEQNAEMILEYENAFPIGAEAIIYVLDDTKTIIDSLTSNNTINAGSYDNSSYLTTPAINSVVFNISRDNILNLQAASKLAVKIAFSTENSSNVKIQSDAFFDFKLRSNLNLDLHL